jgi:DNA-binding MarR family transcriptional regulator
MRLEEEIMQNKFKNEYHRLSVNVIYSGNWINLMSCKYLKPFGLTSAQFNVLRILRGQYPKPVTVNLIIERMLDKMSNASRIVDKLVQKKLSERKICFKDRRRVDVVITNKGMKLLNEIAKCEDEWFSRFKVLNVNEAKKLNTLLDKLRG